MTSTEFTRMCERLERGEIGPGLDFDRVGNGARIGVWELQIYLPALEAAYRRKCRDNQILRARIRTLEDRLRRLGEEEKCQS